VQRRIKALVVTAPEPLREQLRALPTRTLVATCAAASPDHDRAGPPATAATIALRSLARRHQQLTTDIAELDALIAPLSNATSPARSTPCSPTPN
jgi:transposase